jgi:DNA-binding HxlR family transcriptional regulator
MNKRSHKQNCSLAYAADILSERWTLLIVRELLLKPCRYGELLNNLSGMGTNLLANRLKELSELELIEKQQSRYQLTALGQSLEPTILGLIRWGFQLSKELSDPSYLHRPEWDLLAIKSLFNPANSSGIKVCMQVTFLEDTDQSKQTRAVKQAWILIADNRFSFQFEKPDTEIDIHWTYKLSQLAQPQAERLLANPKESNALKRFLSTFDPID